MNDARTDRSRVLGLADDLDSGYAAPGERAAKFLGRVFDGGSMPTELDHYFLVHPVEVDGTPAEGGTPSYATDAGKSVAVDVIGPKVPAVGDLLTCHRVGGRWVSGQGGSGPETCLITYHVIRCGAPLAGASVGIWTDPGKGTAVAGGTTDADGNVTLDVGAAGTYYREISKSGSVTSTATEAIACGATHLLALTPDGAHPCPGGDCCLGTGIPETLYVTDSLGTTAVVLGVDFDDAWTGTGSFTVDNISVVTVVGLGFICVLGTGVLRVYYKVYCTFPRGPWQVERYWGKAHTTADQIGYYHGDGHAGSPTDGCTYPWFPGYDAEGSTGTDTASPCRPFALSGSMTPLPDNLLDDPGGGSFAVSE